MNNSKLSSGRATSACSNKQTRHHGTIARRRNGTPEGWVGMARLKADIARGWEHFWHARKQNPHDFVQHGFH